MTEQIIAVHAGGRGNLGIVGALFPLGQKLSVYVIEAVMEEAGRWGSYENKLHKRAMVHGTPVHLIKACLSDREKDIEFKIMHDTRASSVYEIHPGARDYCRWSSTPTPVLVPWGEACSVIARIPMTTTTLDDLCEDNLPIPNVLSMDIQGSEYDALCGATSLLSSNNLLCITCEAAMNPYYAGQGTFTDIDRLLRSYGFQFLAFTSIQEWWDDRFIVGAPLIAATEALFVRCLDRISDVGGLIRLGIVLHLFGYHCQGNKLANVAIARGAETHPLWITLKGLQQPMKAAYRDFQAKVAKAKHEQASGH